jgi:hypothetical protein
VISYGEVCAGRRKETSLHKLGTALVVAVILALMASTWAVFEARKSASNLSRLIDEDVVPLGRMHELAILVRPARATRARCYTAGTRCSRSDCASYTARDEHEPGMRPRPPHMDASVQPRIVEA